jgi:hypothetical protein
MGVLEYGGKARGKNGRDGGVGISALVADAKDRLLRAKAAPKGSPNEAVNI